MPIRVEWGDEQKMLILMTFEGAWTWEDFDASVDMGREMVDSVGHVVDIIVDVRERPNPLKPNALLHYRKAWVDGPQNYGQFVIVGGLPFMRRFIEVVFKILNRPDLRRFARTVEEAKALIREQRARQLSQ